MSLRFKQYVIAVLGMLFLGSLIYVQRMEVLRKEHETAGRDAPVVVPASSERCVDCHTQSSPGIVEQWKFSTHAHRGVGCVECHQAEQGDADAFLHEGALIAAVVTPKDCGRCHGQVFDEFTRSHHAKGGNILASLDNFLAEVVEGKRDDSKKGTPEEFAFNPHGKTPGRDEWTTVNGRASAVLGCLQCHGSKVALLATDGGKLTLDELEPGKDGKPTNLAAYARIKKDANGRCWTPTRGRTPASAASTSTARGAVARRATAATTSRRGARASPRTAASATSAPITRRRRSTRSPSTASPTATCASA
jgi:hydroxylamine dehydrogenase